MTGPLTDLDLPGIWRDADAASGQGQVWTLRYVRLRLVGCIVAALAAVLSFQIGQVDVAAIAILAGFTVSLLAEIAGWIHKPEALWHDGRAVAESAKTLAWRYAVGADPFPMDLDHAQAHELLRRRLAEISEEAAAHITITAPSPITTQGMQALRDTPFPARRAAYIKGRTEDQHKWYAQKAVFNRARATGWRVALVAAEVMALVLASLRVFGNWQVDLAGLMAALIAAGGAWVAVKQYASLAAAYSIAAMELALQSDKLNDVSEADWPLVAADAEEAISREHTMWLASRTGRRPKT